MVFRGFLLLNKNNKLRGISLLLKFDNQLHEARITDFDTCKVIEFSSLASSHNNTI